MHFFAGGRVKGLQLCGTRMKGFLSMNIVQLGTLSGKNV